jgi:hypothetical protein
MWVESGVALMTGRPSVFLTPARTALPPCLRGLSSEHAAVRVYRDHATLLKDLELVPAALLLP